MMDMNDGDESTIVNALHVAAEEYEKEARLPELTGGMRQHFAKQASEVRALADKIEEQGLAWSTTGEG